MLVLVSETKLMVDPPPYFLTGTGAVKQRQQCDQTSQIHVCHVGFSCLGSLPQVFAFLKCLSLKAAVPYVKHKPHKPHKPHKTSGPLTAERSLGGSHDQLLGLRQNGHAMTARKRSLMRVHRLVRLGLAMPIPGSLPIPL